MIPKHIFFHSIAALGLVALPSSTAHAVTYRQGDCGDFTVAVIPDT